MRCLRPIEGSVMSYASSSVADMKGLEFQHVLMFLSPARFRGLTEQFDKSGKPEYNARRLLRIPASRAKDSLIIFVLEAPSTHQ